MSKQTLLSAVTSVLSVVVTIGLLYGISSYLNHTPFHVQASDIQPVGQTSNYKLVFSDDFNGTTLDTSKWVTCYYWADHGCTVDSNNEAEWYQPDEVTVNNGILRLRAEKKTVTAPTGKTYTYTSGMISTGRIGFDTSAPAKFKFLYGYAEIRAKFPKGKGVWPSFFALADDHSWPPEIDIAEYLGEFPNSVLMNLFWGTGNTHHDDSWFDGPDLSADWHTYAIDWQADHLSYIIDGVERKRVTNVDEIPHKPMFLIANLAVGGWAGDPAPDTVFPSYYDIDYIRVWDTSATPITPTPAAPTTYGIYDDRLLSGWQDWSWGSTNNFSDTNTPFSGSRDIAWKSNNGWAGLYLHTDNPVDANNYSSLSFALKPTSSSQQFEILLYDENNKAIGSAKNLTSFGGPLQVGQYKQFTIPLNLLGATGKKISGLHIQNVTDSQQPEVFVDAISLIKATTTPQPTVQPTAQPTPQPTSTPVPTITPQPTATPQPTVMPTPEPTAQGLKATYFDNIDFTGTSIKRIDPTINFDWGYGSPDPLIGVDTFSARWTGYVVPKYSETYTFSSTVDDGVRVWVNGKLIINAWRDGPATEFTGQISLIAGQKYPIIVEYYDNTYDASMKLSWSSASQAKEIIPATSLIPADVSLDTTHGLSATYFDNMDFTGTSIKRIDPTINFDWGYGSPDPLIGDDTFSARWTGTIQPPTNGTYTFSATSDDGVRVWINGRLMIDGWGVHPPTEYSADITLIGGQKYPIKVEYFENTAGALMQLFWTGPNITKQIVPTDYLYTK